jgi:hypothetical protein
MHGQLTDADRERIDAQIGKEPIGPVLDLWGALVCAGGMPAMSPDHVRAIIVAFRRERGDPIKPASEPPTN